ncbi:hypothetical protein Tco_1575621 [Tanacetum coccineum]
MLKLRASQEGLAERITDDGIMDKVLGSSRSFKPGRGRKLPNSALSTFRIKTSSYDCPLLSTLNDFMDDASDESDEGGAHEDAADPGDE